MTEATPFPAGDARPSGFDEATWAQVRAANPAASVWLGANAGSGKTRVLTDRVAWLLLDGTPPDRILCLTYTKAAAGEMQNRLFQRLGEWAMLDDDALRAALLGLGVRRGTVETEELRRARTLFARAIETPGGLKIQTIHAFCAGLLRRFPLEAGVSPAFREMDDLAGAAMRTAMLDRIAEDAPDAMAALAAHAADARIDSFAAEAVRHAEALAHGADEAAMRAFLGIDDAAEAAAVPDAADMALLATLRPHAEAATTKAMQAFAFKLAALAAAPEETRFDLLADAIMVQDRSKPSSTVVGAKALKEADGGAHHDALLDLAARVQARVDRQRADANLARMRALHGFAPGFLAHVAEEKARRGWLDFDDQIRLARRLLCEDPGVAQWVLHKLDGGIDHVLVDEAQDTSPKQWRLVQALISEFGAGLGAREDLRRTLFVVGDRKQSIFSFQGADPDAFDAMRHGIGAALEGGPAPLRDHALLHSFRSAPAVLRLVDAVAAETPGVGAPPEHIAFAETLPGRVDLWPPFEDEEGVEQDWGDPVDARAPDAGVPRLARAVAARIHKMLADGEPVVEKGAARAIEPGDILILTRSRGPLFHAIIAEIKRLELPLAGADRVALSDEVAVQDLLAALRVAATPEDDLSLAEVLRSPLADVDEDALFRLAHPRETRPLGEGRAWRAPLWRALRDSDAHPRETAMIRDLMDHADFLRPYEMLQRILIRHDGMRRLIGRLGEEAREGIEVLLQQALAFEQLEVPSLTGFLEWLSAAQPEVKRQSGSGAIRIMTVHGAKGLEAPVVILPDTHGRWNNTQDDLAAAEDGTVVWMPPKAEMSPALAVIDEARRARTEAERDRLLYVALTRAAQWLIVAMAGTPPKRAATPSWYDRVAGAMATADPCPAGEGPPGTLRMEEGDWSRRDPWRAPDADAALPDGCEAWLESEAPAAPPLPETLAPSDLGGAKALAGEHLDAFDRDDAMARGTRVHLLLEHLPGVPAEGRASVAATVLAREGWADPLDVEDALDEAAACLDAPGLAWVFADGTLAEAPFVLPPEGDRPEVSGTMDRVVVSDEEVWAVDHKTNAEIPATPEDVPEGLLRQLGAYAAALGAIYPDRAVRVAILWTAEARLMEVPRPVVDAAWARATSRKRARAQALRAASGAGDAIDPPAPAS
ncbi:double-strand break repair helicase AddA [Jannaschia sp. Os4]|uniref:double-strand break repair helicase AddA n=1 Tax=Jannaschia sp. Os4 TaxID=2807617 RepID=UPI0031B56955